MPNAQLTPMRARPVGLGAAVCPGLDTILQNANAKSAWDAVTKQLQAEGGDQYGACLKFTEAYNGLITQTGIDPQIAANSARDLVLVGKTVAGAIQTVNGLVRASKDPSAFVPQVLNPFMGTLVGIATSTGLLTAGAGAAITFGVAIAGQLLSGLFGGPPQGVSMCGVTVSGDTSRGVGCVLASPIGNAPWVNSPNTAGWRSFPSAANGDDAPWFTARPDRGFAWRDIEWMPLTTWQQGQAGPMPKSIELAFDAYHQLACEASVSYALPGISIRDIGIIRGASVVAFLSAYFTAWKANKEWALNGLQAQPDEQVLLRLLRIWNSAHDPGDGFDFASSSDPPLAWFADCSQLRSTYVSQLVQRAVALGGPDAIGGKLHLNTGNQKTNKFVAGGMPIGSAREGAVGGLLTKSNVAGLSLGAKIAIGVGAAAVLAAGGVGVYAWRSHQSYGQAWKSVGRGTSSASKKAWSAVKKPFTKGRK